MHLMSFQDEVFFWWNNDQQGREVEKYLKATKYFRPER